MDDYMSNPACALIKVHGSIDCGREVDTPLADVASTDPWALARQLIVRGLKDLDVSNAITAPGTGPVGRLGGRCSSLLSRFRLNKNVISSAPRRTWTT